MKLLKLKLPRWNKGALLGQMVGGFLVIIIGISLIPLVAQQVSTMKNDPNIENASPFGASMLGVIPLLFAMAVLGIAGAITYSSLRSVVGGDSDVVSDTSEEEKPKPKKRRGKQTYLEFVQERLAVEREMRRSEGFFWWLKR